MQVADVTGHGLSAAFIGSMTKLALVAANKEKPDELLKEMNRLMAAQIPSGRFVTMATATYFPDTGKIMFARAGHPPALLLQRRTNTVKQLMGDGFAIGFFDDSSYSIVEEQMEVGDALLLYTDGISEAQNLSNATYGLDRLSAALLNTSPDDSTADILGKVLDDFDTFRQERMLKDDVTLIALRRLA